MIILYLSNTLSNENFSGLKLAYAYIILYLILLIKIEMVRFEPVTVWLSILYKYLVK
jgi:hypothetical protein